MKFYLLAWEKPLIYRDSKYFEKFKIEKQEKKLLRIEKVLNGRINNKGEKV